MKKRFLGLFLATSAMALCSIKASAAENFTLKQDFNWNGNSDIGTPGGSTNPYNVHQVGDNTFKYEIVNLEGNGAIQMSSQTESNNVGKISIRENNNTIYNKPNTSMVIKTRFFFTDTYGKTLQLYFGAGQVNSGTKTYKLFQRASGQAGKFSYELGGSAKTIEGYNLTNNVWHDLVAVLEDNPNGDMVHMFIDGVNIYSDSIATTDDFKGVCSDLNFNYPKTNAGQNKLSWTIDYVYVGGYNGGEASANNFELNEGETKVYEPTITATNPAYDVSVPNYKVIIPEGSPLTYNPSEKKFEATAVDTDTDVTVTFDFADPNISDKEIVVKVKNQEAILPTEIKQTLFSGDITLSVGQEIDLNKVFSVNAAATNQGITFEAVENDGVFSISGNKLTALKSGNAKLKVIASGDTNVTKTVNVVVASGAYNELNQYDTSTSWQEPGTTAAEFKSVLPGSSFTYSPISVVEDSTFGKAIKFSGVGGANGGASRLDAHFGLPTARSTSSNLTANKDYKLTGWIKMNDTSVNITGSNAKMDIKVIGYYTKDGNAVYATQSESAYYSMITYNRSTMTGESNDTWVYFETEAVNLDTGRSGNGLEGFKIELVSYRNHENLDMYVTNLAFVEQESVSLNTWSGIKVDDTLVSGTINAVVGNEKAISLVIVPSTATMTAVYTSSDENIATVSTNGVITFLKGGTVEITINANGQNKKVRFSVADPLTKIEAESSAELKQNEVKSIDIMLTPANATSTLKISVADTTICSVRIANGKLIITGLKTGSTTVTLTSSDDSNVNKVITITVIKAAATDITAPESGTVEVGATINIGAVATPEIRTEDITYVSSNPAVATVSNDGVITGVSAGSAKITLTVDNVTKEYTITVVISSTGITVLENNIELKAKDTYQITTSVTPSNTTDTVTYVSSDTNVATVDANGIITAVAAGTATISVSCGDKTTTITLTVLKPMNVAVIIVPVICGVVAIAAAAAFLVLRRRKK